MPNEVLPHALFDTARDGPSAPPESDDATGLEWWIDMPAELAQAVSDPPPVHHATGQPDRRLAFDGDEHYAWHKGVEIGRRMGQREPPVLRPRRC